MLDYRIQDLVNDLIQLWKPELETFHPNDMLEVGCILGELEQYTTNMRYEQVEPVEEELTNDKS